jgi:hypothetical protein
MTVGRDSRAAGYDNLACRGSCSSRKHGVLLSVSSADDDAVGGCLTALLAQLDVLLGMNYGFVVVNISSKTGLNKLSLT